MSPPNIGSSEPQMANRQANPRSSRPPRLLADCLPEKQVAREIGVTVRTLRTWRVRRCGPPWTKVGREVFYRRVAFCEWLKAQEQQPVRSSRRRTEAA
jgi:hypothetical protein